MTTTTSWQPATTLPLPLNAVIAYIPSYGHDKPRRIRAMWVPRQSIETDDDLQLLECTCDIINESYYLPEGWYEDSVYGDVYYPVTDTVTHWCPLPEPPS